MRRCSLCDRTLWKTETGEICASCMRRGLDRIAWLIGLGYRIAPVRW